ncbi:PAS domain-containing sensor histidine kinase [Lysobacter sp. A6]|uniref:histidine kinase n=1 Tax=Noviluteimonas lactosilytica TaxID=2888523 RepID=A0ABS8JJJ1_9GAMM|nr:PAS domain-containing sensor histidine kinase [Lysobacter lactosilyticus]MCC8363767.1 PAS domain-containing sensor histidine kinase [Lysobacter lactosilyticus]
MAEPQSNQVIRVLESITDGFFTVDANWRFVYVNREAERILGRSREELIGRNFWAEYPGTIGEIFEREYRRAVDEQRTVQFEAYYGPLDIWVDVRAYPSPDGLSVYFRDISVRKAAQERLRESERNFRVLANSIPQLAWMADATGWIFWYSTRWYEYTGTTPEQMDGWGWQQVHHPDHVARVVERIRRAFESGEPWEDTFPLRSRTGEYRWFLSRAEPIKDAEGNVLRWFGTNTDITDQRRAEEALRESEARYRLLADLIPQHIWTTDAEGYHTYFSRRWYDFAGLDYAASEGEGWLQLLHPDDVERTLARWQHSLATGEPYVIEYRFLGVDGHYHWFLGQAKPLRDDAGRIIEWFGTATDISERKRLEEERERLLESRASLMRGFGHDLKNPLGTAHMHAQLLERGMLPGELSEKQRDSVVVIRRSIRNAVKLIDDLLELAQAEAGQLVLTCVPTDTGELLREVAGDFRQQAMAAELRLETRTRDGLHGLADPARLRQILGNLLSNAAKYAPKGFLDLVAEHRASGGPRPGSWVAVSVRDSGPGIPLDKQESIFHEYVRLDPDAAQGVGIGLAISRQFSRLMGGDLTVDSEPGHGSTFTIWLPCVDCHSETASAA